LTAAAFFAFVIITTKKSFCFIPQPSRSRELFCKEKGKKQKSKGNINY
jgi:hypothetical protein